LTQKPASFAGFFLIRSCASEIAMNLEVLSRLPETANGKPPLLFVHGAWLSADCWDQNFLPYFAERGYPAHAVSLRGHGRSPRSLHWASMTDYVADVAEVAAKLPEPPVLIGHSMGGGVVQKYLETHDAPAAILLGSMPPHGMSAAFMDAWRRHPMRWLQANFSMNTKCLFASPGLCREFFFSASMPDAEIIGAMRSASDESLRALFDMSLPHFLNPARVKTPIHVIGGEKDVVIPPRDVEETARRYQTEARVLADVPHAMMLDLHWRKAADAVADWLAAQFDEAFLGAKEASGQFGAPACGAGSSNKHRTIRVLI
jgi:pimeloyl-ACP methyl ester carboxylesterase